MLLREAQWLGRRLEATDLAQLFPMVNLGSQTKEFRVRIQPWIDRYLFSPLRRRGGTVLHVDLQQAQGVDLVGDLTEPAFHRRLREHKVRCVLCCNLLEHVTSRESIVRAIIDLLPVGGLAFVSVPYRFPYHPDPIDTMFRPDVPELAALFSGMEIVEAAELKCGTLSEYFLARLWYTPEAVGRQLFSLLSRNGGKNSGHADKPVHSAAVNLLPWMFRTVSTTCMVLRKLPASPDGKVS